VLFHASRLKIERAEKHIHDLDLVLKKVASPSFYRLYIEQDLDRINWVILDFGSNALPADDAALIIGDALHNLRSALDILWHKVIEACGGTTSSYTRFLVRDTEDELVAPLKNALEHKQITEEIYRFILNVVKPCKAGNYPIWALDDLNIRDKHQLIIPIFKLMWVFGVCLEDDQGKVFYPGALMADEPCRIKLPIELYGKKLTVKNKGHAAPNVFFQLGFPFESEPIMPSLSRIAEEVTRTVEEFELIFGRDLTIVTGM
jgi:hypothetical protein